MEANYNHGYLFVNNQGCLTDNNYGCSFRDMNYSDRLKTARKHAGLTQKALVEKIGRKPDGNLLMSQANLAKMETNPRTQGSMFTPLIAQACGINAIWLATGQGEMEGKPDFVMVKGPVTPASGMTPAISRGRRSPSVVEQPIAAYQDERDQLLRHYAGMSQAHKKDLLAMAELWFKADNPELLLPIIDDEQLEPELRKAEGI
jgi:transcriptional regulator with XRE-family HTH domain